MATIGLRAYAEMFGPTTGDRVRLADTDLLILPRPEGVDIRDWKAYAPAVSAGYAATQAALVTLKCPVEHLHRHRVSAFEQQETDEEMVEVSTRPLAAETPAKAARPTPTGRPTA